MSVNASRTPLKRNRIGRRARGVAFASVAAVSLALLSSAPASAAGVYGPYVYKNQGHGGCLAGSSTALALESNCNASITAQKWKVTTFPSGFVSLKNVSSGKCIDVNLDRQIYMNACNNSNYQAFYEVKVTSAVRSYKPAHHAAYCIGVSAGSGSGNPGKIGIGSCGGKDASWLQEKVR
ncbi:RICIN domain-containing protein [Nonomuraea sp. LPB2021202275-12-8]|uniref:RICIN domain-containing protein n=1 Tax=Nonomuraea sp. LPB2021202275-12-8 TaxID=3120159 RepID=UPI00300D75EC